MLLHVTKALYYLAQNTTMVFLFAAMFEYRKEMNFPHKLVQIIVLTSVQIICSAYIPTMFVPIVMVVVFCLVSQIDGNLSGRSLVIEVTFVFAVREILRTVTSFAAIALYMFVTQKKSMEITAVLGAIMPVTACCFSLPFLRKLKLPEFGEDFSLGHLAFVLVLAFWALGQMQATYSPANRALSILAFFALLLSLGLLYYWVRDGKRFTTLNGVITERTRANHELTRTILGMNQRKAVAAARALNKTGRFSVSFAEGGSLGMGLDAILGPTIQVDTDTGIHALDVILYEAKERAKRDDINFDCEIGAKLNPLTKRSGITTASLRVILRNLLEMAFDFAITTEREPRVVDCLVSEDEGIFRIEIYDSGEAFPPGVLHNLGCRGTPEEDDMAEVLVMLARCDASLFISEEEKPTATGTARHVMVQFDGAGVLKVTSPHAGEDEIQIKKALKRKIRKKEENVYVPDR